MYRCKKCGKQYEQNLITRSDPDKCPHCGAAQWEPGEKPYKKLKLE